MTTEQQKAKELVEKWLPVVGYEDYYEVSDFGSVRNISTGRILKPCDRGMYFSVTLSVGGNIESKNIHRLVCTAFWPNPQNKKQINHKNSNRYDNRAENLEWATPKENRDHAVNAGRLIPVSNNREDLSMPIEQYSLSGEFIASYPSGNEAARQTGVERAWIHRCANGGSYRTSGGERKWVVCNSSGGFKWKWQQVKTEIEKL
jgi:hypothetical protein